MRLQKDLREFIESLNSNSVEYVIVGGLAVAFHGYVRYTRDIDILIRPTSENARRVEKAISQFGFAGLGLTAEEFVRPDLIVQLGHPPNRVDLITSLSGIEAEDVWARRVSGDLDGLPVHFIDKSSLLTNKRSTGRPQDIADAAAIE